MTEANYLVRITGKDAACLTEQLVCILQTIEPFIKDVVWYIADLDADRTPPDILKYKECTPKRVGQTGDLILLSQKVHQFLSGVFLALPNDQGDLLNCEYGTEERAFRDMGDAVLEIRAFDTSYYEFYSNNFDLIHKISRNFYGIIEYNVSIKSS